MGKQRQKGKIFVRSKRLPDRQNASAGAYPEDNQRDRFSIPVIRPS